MADVSKPVSPTAAAPAAESTEAPVKKKKYSNKNYKKMEKADRKVSRAGKRLAKAITKGIANWEKNREKSARKKKDGAMVKVIENSAHAFGTFVRGASRVPADLAKAQPKMMKMAMPFGRRK